jgi:hypothetical protein
MDLIIIKKNHLGQETWRYSGRLVERTDHQIILEAFFDRDDMDLHGMPLRRGDRFRETWYSDRWYNIFEIFAVEDGRLRGWYCNIGRPAEFSERQLSYEDLALDLLVFADGRQIVLDEDEFEALEIAPETRQSALTALQDLQRQFQAR